MPRFEVEPNTLLNQPISSKNAGLLGALVLCLLALGSVALFAATRAKVAPGLTRSGLLRVQPGMPEDQVIAELGHPVEVRVTPIRAPATAGRSPQQVDAAAWTYARPGLFDRLEVNVIVANGVVASVDVEYDDAVVYTTNGVITPSGPPLSDLLE